MRKFKDGLRQTGEWLLILTFMVSSVATLLSEPLEGGPMVELFGGAFALVFYALLFFVLAVLLLLSKVRKMKKLHLHSLMAMYITTIFTGLLTLLLTDGWTQIIDDIVVGLIAAWCWLAWKIKTQYLHPNQFDAMIAPLLDEPLTTRPPSDRV